MHSAPVRVPSFWTGRSTQDRQIGRKILHNGGTMNRTRSNHLCRHLRWLSAVLLAWALFLTGCGGDGTTTESASTSGSRDVPRDPVFSVGENEGREMLTTVDGFSLYVFSEDPLSESKCIDACANTFIPFAAPDDIGQRAAGDGVQDQLVGFFERPDGISQLTYRGRPLYRFSADAEPGLVGGEGSGGKWFLVTPGGDRVARLPAG